MTAVLTIEPVLALLGVNPADPDACSVVDAAALLGIDRRTLQRWRYGRDRSGPVSLDPMLADELATRRLGLHPCEVWGNWWDA